MPAGGLRPAAEPGLARGDHRQRLIDKLAEDVGGALLARHHADALPGHQRAALDIAVDHRAAQRPGPEMLDFELRVLLRQLAAVEAVDDRALRRRGNRSVAAFASARTGMTGKRASSWTDGTASRAVARMNARLKRGWAINSWAQTNRVPSCTPAAPISRYDTIASPRPIPPATNTGTSPQMGKHFLCQHRGRDRPDMAAGLAALDDDRIGPGAHQLAGDRQGRREADDAGAAVAQALDRRASPECRRRARHARRGGRCRPRSARRDAGAS